MRRRRSFKGLTNSRIYAKGLRFYFFASRPVENPATGKVSKWHPLGLIADGEDKARAIAAQIIKHNKVKGGAGDFAKHIEDYRLLMLAKREKKRPKEKAREKMFAESQKELTRQCNMFGEAFGDFNLDQVAPVDVARFLDQWEGQRAAEFYRSRLSDFFAWACRRGLRNDNPVREVKVEKAKGRKRYITDAEYHAIRDAALVGKDGKPTQSGKMLQAFIDMCYLTMQRPTEIRLLKWADAQGDAILFTPTKTEESSGAGVEVPITAAIREALDRAKAAAKVRSFYVFPTRKGQPYTGHGIGTAWERACDRAKVENATLRDLRAKAATDAKKAGHAMQEIAVGLAHANERTTEVYIKERQTPVLGIPMQLPKR